MIKINGNVIAGVTPGKGFRSALEAPLEMKAYIVNESRLEDGSRVIVGTPKKAMRSLTLEFQITGATPSDFNTSYNALLSAFYAGSLTLETDWSTDVYHLVYTGKSSSYDCGLGGCACKIKVGFDEPNPGNRASDE